MLVFWLQGGLHLEPENPVESEAMMLLLHDVKYIVPVEQKLTPDEVKRLNAEQGGSARGNDIL